MTHWRKLHPVEIREGKGKEKLAMVENGNDNESIWEFLKVGIYK
jgi:hypothetical protein